MELLALLILLPAMVALVLLAIRNETVRTVIVCASAAVIACASIALCTLNVGSEGLYFMFESRIVDVIAAVISVALAGLVLAYAYRYRNIPAAVLAAIQLVAALAFDVFFGSTVEVVYGLYFDSLSLIMAFIIGVVGSGICVYALGYMRDYQAEHANAPDRRPVFFALMFLFLSAMYVIIFSNNMTWMFTGWEVTTVCSFLLIGYSKTDEAIANAFRQIIMNLAGGLGFLAALYFSAIALQTLSFVDFTVLGAADPTMAALPLTCLAFAGITKAAQMPFHSWLLGAMVAPTPTSALLHSSTMVKAGVFLLIKLAPVLAVSTAPALMVILVGGITFCLASFLAISQTNAKRVLAYSTIANLGLIVACAGVGTPEAVWAAIFLVVFHAIAKSLLFLCVGTAEHHIGSRDIEDMDLLFERMPRLARLMMFGIMAMFIAPFGMLISKWATLVSFIDTRQIALILLLAYGSAATFLFWGKWLGKLAGIAGKPDNVETSVFRSEWSAIVLMAVLLLACCALLPLASSAFAMPYIESIYGFTQTAIDDDILWITSILSVVVMIVLFAGLNAKGDKTQRVDVYLSGVSVDSATRTFRNSMSKDQAASVRNMYMDDLFGEAKITPVGIASTVIIIVAAFAMSTVSLFGLF